MSVLNSIITEDARVILDQLAPISHRLYRMQRDALNARDRERERTISDAIAALVALSRAVRLLG